MHRTQTLRKAGRPPFVLSAAPQSLEPSEPSEQIPEPPLQAKPAAASTAQFRSHDDRQPPTPRGADPQDV